MSKWRQIGVSAALAWALVAVMVGSASAQAKGKGACKELRDITISEVSRWVQTQGGTEFYSAFLKSELSAVAKDHPDRLTDEAECRRRIEFVKSGEFKRLMDEALIETERLIDKEAHRPKPAPRK